MSGFNQDPTPQFGKAEYVGTPGNDHCQYCHQPVSGTYYRVNEAMTCPACADRMRGVIAKDSHAAFVRALLFGIGASIVGMALYAAFAILTGIIIGYASLAVGWMIGKAMLAGSRGAGGRRYQITAVVLTYLAVSMSAVPIGMSYAVKHRSELAVEQTKQRQSTQQLADEQRQLEGESGQQKQPPASEPQPDNAQDTSQSPEPPQTQVSPDQNRMSPLESIARLAMLGVASPFLELTENSFGGMIGIVILIIGMRIAWRMTAGRAVEIFGPFEAKSNPT